MRGGIRPAEGGLSCVHHTRPGWGRQVGAVPISRRTPTPATPSDTSIRQKSGISPAQQCVLHAASDIQTNEPTSATWHCLCPVCERVDAGPGNRGTNAMKHSMRFYWIVTGLMAAFMLMASVPDVLQIPQAVEVFTHLGYPTYLLPFPGAAKTLGVVTVLIPGFRRLKEWAYAGLVFDLIGALYSHL